MSNLRLPAVVHFVSDGKPWKIIAMEYLNLSIPSTTLIELKKQEYVHLFWRIKYFKATGDQPPQRSLFGEEADQLFQSILHHVHNKRQNTNYLEKLDILYDRNKKYQEEEEELKRNEIKKLLKNQNKKNFQSRKEEVSSQSSDKKRKKRQNDRKTSRKHRNQPPRQSRNEL